MIKASESQNGFGTVNQVRLVLEADNGFELFMAVFQWLDTYGFEGNPYEGRLVSYKRDHNKSEYRAILVRWASCD